MARYNKERERYSIKFTTYQKEEHVTGSMHVVEVCGLKIILDMGMYQGNRMGMVDRYRLNEQVLKYDYSDVDYICIAHLHADHCSLLPIVKRSDIDFKGVILATELTAKMVKLNNQDGAFLMQSECDAWNKLHPNEKCIPLYNKQEVEDVQIRGYDYNTKIRLNDNVYLTFLANSHVCGAASIYITVEEDGRLMNSLLYTSDLQYSKNNKPFTMAWNSGKIKVHNLVIESTYADRIQEPYNAVDELEQVILNAIRNKRPLMIGTFAFHRSSMILYYLYKIWERNEEIRNADFPIYMAGSLMHKAHKELGKASNELFFDDEWKDTGLWQWEKPIWLTQFKDVETRLSSPTLGVVVATSGMLDKAYSKYLCTRWLGRKEVDLLVSGYCAPETIGGRLLEGAKEVMIDGKMYKVRANFLGKMTLSGHADKNGLCDFIKDCIDKKFLENVLLVHGEYDKKEKQAILYKKILGEKVNVEIPKRYKPYKF